MLSQKVDVMRCTAGKIINSFVIEDSKGGNKGYAFVRFETTMETYKVIDLVMGGS